MTMTAPPASATAGGDLHLSFLDVVRFSAALAVVFGHARGLFFVGIGDVAEPTVAVKAFYLMSGLQHEGVVAFFVVSGFLVGGGALRAFEERRFSMSRYALNRASRIYVVYLPTLCLGALFSQLGIWLFAATRFYAEVPLFPSGVGQGWNWSDSVCHLVVLQRIYCNVAAFNPPLWSLGFEWLLYFVFPLLLYPMFMQARPLARVVMFILVVSAIGTLSPTWRLWIEWPVFWLLGVGSAYVHRKWPAHLALGAVALAVGIAMLPLSRLHIVPLQVTDTILACALAVAFAAPAICSISILPRLSQYAADFSFSMYAVHLPAAVLVGGLLEHYGFPHVLSQPGAETLTAFALTVGVILVLSDALSHLTERRTGQLRAALQKFFGV